MYIFDNDDDDDDNVDDEDEWDAFVYQKDSCGKKKPWLLREKKSLNSLMC